MGLEQRSTEVLDEKNNPGIESFHTCEIWNPRIVDARPFVVTLSKVTATLYQRNVDSITPYLLLHALLYLTRLNHQVGIIHPVLIY